MQPKDQSQLGNINIVSHMMRLLIFYKCNNFKYLYSKFSNTLGSLLSFTHLLKFLSKWHVKNIVFFPVIQIYSLCLSPEHALAM